MLQDLTQRQASLGDPAVRLLTPIVKAVGQRLLRWDPVGSVLIELPNGQRVRFGTADARSTAQLSLANYLVIAKALRRGPLGFAEAYIDGDIDSPDLVEIFRFFIRNRTSLNRSGRGLFKVRMADRLAHLKRRNSRRGSRRNIADHYDLGNNFYRLWLDPSMVYSSALYSTGAASLEEAQAASHDLILAALDPAPGSRILEIGCGWGGLARHAARQRGVKVSGITLSREQLSLALAKAAEADLCDSLEFSLQDYRDVKGQYDHVMSIEMLEAVGEENWRRYFETLNARLKPGGTALIQSITIDQSQFADYRRKTDFIQRYIFPGGMLPTREAIVEHAAYAGLELDYSRHFGNCYARTLAEWRERFEAAWPQIASLGYDEAFRRKWRYYLAYCEAGFLEGLVDVGVYRLRKSG